MALFLARQVMSNENASQLLTHSASMDTGSKPRLGVNSDFLGSLHDVISLGHRHESPAGTHPAFKARLSRVISRATRKPMGGIPGKPLVLVESMWSDLVSAPIDVGTFDELKKRLQNRCGFSSRETRLAIIRERLARACHIHRSMYAMAEHMNQSVLSSPIFKSGNSHNCSNIAVRVEYLQLVLTAEQWSGALRKLLLVRGIDLKDLEYAMRHVRQVNARLRESSSEFSHLIGFRRVFEKCGRPDSPLLREAFARVGSVIDQEQCSLRLAHLCLSHLVGLVAELQKEGDALDWLVSRICGSTLSAFSSEFKKDRRLFDASKPHWPLKAGLKTLADMYGRWPDADDQIKDSLAVKAAGITGRLFLDLFETALDEANIALPYSAVRKQSELNKLKADQAVVMGPFLAALVKARDLWSEAGLSLRSIEELIRSSVNERMMDIWITLNANALQDASMHENYETFKAVEQACAERVALIRSALPDQYNRLSRKIAELAEDLGTLVTLKA